MSKFVFVTVSSFACGFNADKNVLKDILILPKNLFNNKEMRYHH